MVSFRGDIPLAVAFALVHITASDTISVTAAQGSSMDCSMDSPCDVHCDEEGSCRESTINCPDNAICPVECNGINSCHGATVNSGNQSILIIDCIGEDSCRNMMIDADDAAEFVMTGCAAAGSCIGVTLFCPPHLDGTPQCTIFCMFGVIIHSLSLYTISIADHIAKSLHRQR